ncbi:MAG: hypothetical protein K2W95_33610 [Candidatus Obscuribacterales bacterium]|nr:hypothetical protein [Candidatus Obscuribacterales bacterium]
MILDKLDPSEENKTDDNVCATDITPLARLALCQLSAELFASIESIGKSAVVSATDAIANSTTLKGVAGLSFLPNIEVTTPPGNRQETGSGSKSKPEIAPTDEKVASTPVADTNSDSGKPVRRDALVEGLSDSISEHVVAAAPRELPVGDIAKRYEKRLELLLADAHKDLKFTTDGSNPLVIPISLGIKLESDTTIEAIAKKTLGPKTTQEQIDVFVNAFGKANNIEDAARDTKVDKNTSVQVPGQTWDGAISYKEGESGEPGTLKFRWSDGSYRDELADSTFGGRLFQKGDKFVVEQIEISRKFADRNAELTVDGKTSIRLDATGTKRETQDNGDAERVIKQTNRDGSTYQVEYSPDNGKPQKVVYRKPGQRATEFSALTENEFVSADGKLVLMMDTSSSRESTQFYRRRVLPDGGVEKTFGDGRTARQDKNGDKVSETSTDVDGRKFEERFKPGELSAFEVIYKPEGKDSKPIKFERTKGEILMAPFIKDGKKIGYIELSDDLEDVTYRDKVSGIARLEERGGRVTETQKYEDGKIKTVIRQDKEILTSISERSGTPNINYSDGEGLSIEMRTRDGRLEGVTIKHPDGGFTRLSHNDKLNTLTGTHTASNGTTESVHRTGNYFLYRNDKTNEERAFRFSIPKDGMPLFSPCEVDRYTATITADPGDDGKVTIPLFEGRSDEKDKFGTLKGRAVNDETSHVKPSGEAVVQHADGSRVRLNADNTIDRWGPSPEDTGTREALSPAESRLLRIHKDIDRRDFAEIHRSMRGNKARLESFYQELQKLDDVKDLTAQEKSALRRNIMSHVARPAEIQQGQTWTCNAATLQREMVMQKPDKYAAMLVQCFDTGSVKLGDGSTVRVDTTNLKQTDQTGRDFASRAFQSVAIGLGFPGGSFQNTRDGVGILFDAEKRKLPFTGMDMPHIAIARKRLTGEDKAAVCVSNPEDLIRLFKENGGTSMIVSVDGSKPPFGDSASGDHGNHVVTITGIIPGEPTRFRVQNQWGLSDDHSTLATSIKQEDLWAAMLSGGKAAQVIASVKGTVANPEKIYSYADGKSEIDKDETKKFARWLERWKN